MEEINSGNNAYDPDKARNSFATASLVMGIISVMMLCTGVLAIPFGALGVLFAILSRKKNSSFSSTSMTGLVLSATGISLGVVLTAIAVYRILYDPTVWEQLEKYYPDYYKIMINDFQEGGGL